MDKEKILEKLIEEHNELNEKIKKLNAALEDEDISLIQRMLMAEQEKAMSLYAYFLAERIDDLSQDDFDEDEISDDEENEEDFSFEGDLDAFLGVLKELKKKAENSDKEIKICTTIKF